MSKTTPNVVAIRARIDQARAGLARAEGEQSTLQTEIDANLTRLQTLLACKPGKEREAIQALRDKITKDETEIATLLDEAERIRDAPAEEVAP